MNLGKERFHQALIVFWPEHLIAPLRDPFTTPNYSRLAEAYEHAAQDLMALHIFFLYLDKDKAALCHWLHQTARALAEFYRPETRITIDGTPKGEALDRMLEHIEEAVARGDRVMASRKAREKARGFGLKNVPAIDDETIEVLFDRLRNAVACSDDAINKLRGEEDDSE